LVQTGGLKPDLARAKPASAPVLSPGEIIRSARVNVRSIMQKSIKRIDRLLAPASIPQFTLSFDKSSEEVVIHLTVRRDVPLSPDEKLWLERMLSDDLELPVTMTVATMPFVPLLSFEPDQTNLSDQMKQNLIPLREIYRQSRSTTVNIEGVTEREGNQSRKNAAARVREVSEFLTEECHIPSERIQTNIRRGNSPTVRVFLQDDLSPPLQRTNR
jgi:hypothetical protein